MIDIMYLDKKMIFYAVNTATAFETRQFWNNILVRNI